MKKKILFVAKVDSHIRHFQSKFFKDFEQRNYIVDVMSEGEEEFENVRKKYNIKFGKNPFNSDIIKTLRRVKKILREENYDIIQCNTAIASVVVRLAVILNHSSERIVYMAHGFHFYSEGPIVDWLIYYPIEKLFGRVTDSLILINEEDYLLAQKKKIAKHRVLINGIGFDEPIEEPKFSKRQKICEKRKVTFSYIAEINKNKNHVLLVDTLIELKRRGYEIECWFLGDGNLIQWWKQKIVELELENCIHFEGYQNGVYDYLVTTDIYLSSSLREGLGMNVIEALSCGVPVICYPNRGHKEIIIDGHNGYFASDVTGFVDKILSLIDNPDIYDEMCQVCPKSVDKFRTKSIRKKYIDSVIG